MADDTCKLADACDVLALICFRKWTPQDAVLLKRVLQRGASVFELIGLHTVLFFMYFSVVLSFMWLFTVLVFFECRLSARCWSSFLYEISGFVFLFIVPQIIYFMRPYVRVFFSNVLLLTETLLFEKVKAD